MATTTYHNIQGVNFKLVKKDRRDKGVTSETPIYQLYFKNQWFGTFGSPDNALAKAKELLKKDKWYFDKADLTNINVGNY